MSGPIIGALSGVATAVAAGLGEVLAVATTLTAAAPVPAPELTEAILSHFAARTAEVLARRRGITLRRPVRADLIDTRRLRALLDDATKARAWSAAGNLGPDGTNPTADRTLVETRLGFAPRGGAASARSAEPQAAGTDPTGHYDLGTARVLVTWDADLSSGRLAVVRDVAQAVLAQRFDLGSFLGGGADASPSVGPGTRGGSDALWARQALLEGDATVQALEHVEAGGTLPDPRRLADVWEKARASLRTDPLYRESLGGSALSVAARLFTALDGTAFVAAVRTREPWASVDAIWAAPPETAEQILHFDKYVRRERAVPIGERLPGTLARNWRLTYADTLGEIGVRAFLEPTVGEHRADRAATGWGGDRVLVYRRGGTPSGDRPTRARRAASQRSGEVERDETDDSASDDSSDDAAADKPASDNPASDNPAFVAWILAWDTPIDAEDFAAQAAEVLLALAATTAETRQASEPALQRRAHGTVTDAAGRVYAWQREGTLVGLLFGAPPSAEAALGQLMAAASSRTGAPPEKRRPTKSAGPRGRSR